MTRQQRMEQCIEVVQSLTRKQGYSPTIREIAEGMGIGQPVAHQAVRDAVAAGHLTQEPGRARTLRITRIRTRSA